MQPMTSAMRTRRQQALLESIALGEVGFSAHLDGFYFNRVLQFELAAEDQSFLKALSASGEIWHRPLGGGEFEVWLRKEQQSTDSG